MLQVFGAPRASFPVIPPDMNDVLVRYVFGGLSLVSRLVFGAQTRV